MYSQHPTIQSQKVLNIKRPEQAKIKISSSELRHAQDFIWCMHEHLMNLQGYQLENYLYLVLQDSIFIKYCHQLSGKS